jgi:myo-inositol-1(or 4)-monophosphatase
MDERQAWLDIAIMAAKDAGVFLKQASRKPIVVDSSDGRDVKLALDRESEMRIVALLQKQSDFPILSEEMNKTWSPEIYPSYHWIVDPLDGSLNYWKGIPLCCVSIGLWCGAKPVLGAIYDFNRDELFSGIVGIGARLNGASIKVGDTVVPNKAVLCTGFPVSADFSEASLHEFVAFVRAYKKSRLLGSAALSISYVASGRVDAYCERDIKIWDVAAGLAIVEAAGGKNIWNKSNNINAVIVYAANKSLVENAFLQFSTNVGQSNKQD